MTNTPLHRARARIGKRPRPGDLIEGKTGKEQVVRVLDPHGLRLETKDALGRYDYPERDPAGHWMIYPKLSDTTVRILDNLEVSSLSTFAITFGIQYPETPHPRWPDAHHDGYVLISAPDEEAARREAIRRLGQHWGGIYPANTPEEYAELARFYPLGALARWSARPEST